ncbi:MAG TPA: DUF1828 domain-containing protein [Pyrinomonadaceae bacterium]|nr:DUF1828 domain-containing protein [Pyrinomonadaceae bacterium]
MATPCERLEVLSEMFNCTEINNHTRIRTPYLYPDGDVIDLYLTMEGPQAVLTDFGESLSWLKSQTVSRKKSVKQRQLLNDICLTYGVELYHGALTLRVANDDNFALLVTRISQAALSVADLWFTFRSRLIESVTDEVEDFLSERQIAYERNEPFAGRSGKVYRIDFHTRTPARTSLVNVLSSGSQAAAGRIVDHVVTGWYDLNHLKVGQQLRFVSLFDDTMDVWTPENIRLVNELSEVAYWSYPDDLEELLKAA